MNTIQLEIQHLLDGDLWHFNLRTQVDSTLSRCASTIRWCKFRAVQRVHLILDAVGVSSSTWRKKLQWVGDGWSMAQWWKHPSKGAFKSCFQSLWGTSLQHGQNVEWCVILFRLYRSSERPLAGTPSTPFRKKCKKYLCAPKFRLSLLCVATLELAR